MFKKLISLFVCFAAAFTVTVSVFAQSGSAEVEAASSVPLYLKYYYDQMNGESQKAFLKIRNAVINCDKKVTFGNEIDYIDDEELQKVVELLIFHDPMSFNLADMADDPRDPYSLVFKYNYKKETYDKMVSAYEKKVDTILDKLTDDMSTYKKIKAIHDSIINTATYDLESPYNGTIYGTLVQKKARCVGYAHTFAYICSRAGIQTVTVIGYDYPVQNEDEMHMWNKVYYSKKWYNVDLTWDDPSNNLKNNIIYDYFFVSDDRISLDHVEDNFSFETPEAVNNAYAYYILNKKYAEDIESAKDIIKSGINTAAKNGTAVVRFQCSSRNVYKKVQTYLDGDKVYDVLESAKKSTNKDLVDTAFNYAMNDGQYTVTILLFYKNTSLDKYYSDPEQVSKDTKTALKKYGIK